MKIESIVQSAQEFHDAKRAALNLLYTHNMLTEGLSSLLKKYDLSGEQFNVLRILRGAGQKPANMGMIQQRMIAKTSNTTRLVDKLLAKDLVMRKVCPDNRRKMEVWITSKGLKLLDIVDPLVDQFEADFFDRLSNDELIHLIQLLEKIRT